MLAEADDNTTNRIMIEQKQQQEKNIGIQPHLHDALDALGSQSRQMSGFLARFRFV